MKTTMTGIAVLVAVMIVGVTATRMSQRRVAPRSVAPSDRLVQTVNARVSADGQTAPPAVDAVSPAGSDVRAESKPPVVKPSPAPVANDQAPVGNDGAKPAAPRTANRPGKEPPIDPLARIALAFVGADPEAEAYWLEAINDPTLPAQERQDLIEDLNEDGLSDAKHPTARDLPVILQRLAIIEWVEAESIDRVNADAFQEAYKDLVNLANVAMGAGEPVK